MLLPGVGLGFLCEFEQGLAAGVSLASKSGLGGQKQGVKVFGVSGFGVHGLHAGVMLLDHMSCP